MPTSKMRSDRTSADKKDALDCAAAEALGGQICTAASLSAQSECQLLELIGEFDAGNAVRWWAGVTSLAHWLSWACSMSPGTAREHVRRRNARDPHNRQRNRLHLNTFVSIRHQLSAPHFEAW